MFAPFRFANRSKALILMYHRFSAKDDAGAISAGEFEKQLDYLQARYEVVPLSFVAERLISGRSLPHRVAVITIDDGYRDVYTEALPLLHRRNLPATMFVVTDFIDGKTWLWTDKARYLTGRAPSGNVETIINGRPFRFNLDGPGSREETAALVNDQLKLMADHAKEEAINHLAASLGIEIPPIPPAKFAPLAWDEVRKLDSSGVEIGSHTVTHPILTHTGGTRLRHELTESRSRLEQMLGRKVTLFCYPNGDVNGEVRREVERAGYTSAVTTRYGFNDNKSDALALARIPAANDLARFARSTSGFEQLRLSLKGASRGATGLSTSMMRAER